MSTATPIKFRCSQCNKLLGVSRSKVGTVVACPQCSAELIVPDPAEAPPAPAPKAPEPPRPAKPSPSGSQIEPVVVPWDAAPAPEPPASEAMAFPAIEIEPVSLRPDPPARLRTALRPRSEPSSKPPPEPVPLPQLVPPAPSPPRSAPSDAGPFPPEPGPVLLPKIEVETPLRDEPALRIVGSPSIREATARRSDVVMPRTAVVLWSFLVLMAIVLAFATGLLAGRFLWAPGVGVRSATVGGAGTAPPPG